jgi:hypothetical protein
MMLYAILIAACLLPWAACGFVGLGAKALPFVRAGFSVFLLLTASTLVFAHVSGT